MILKKLSLAILTLSLFLLGCDGSGGSKLNRDNPLARTSMVGHWNHVAIDASGLDHSSLGARENLGPTRSSRAMAIVHIAIHDAIQSIEGKYATFSKLADAPATSSREAAVAQAAHDTLVALFPSQRDEFAKQLSHDLDSIPEGSSKEQGILAGQLAAEAILRARTGDGSEAAIQNASYTPKADAGIWRPDPLNPGQSALGPFWSKVRPFVMISAEQFRSPPPPALSSTAYAESYAEAYRLGGDGITTPTERTEEQTEIGLFWAYDGTPSLCAPPRLYNQIALQIAADRGVSDLGELARLLALVNIAMADAGIASWETKYFYNLWRPITGIRESDPGTGPLGQGDGNPLTPGDLQWSPLGAPASNLSANNFTPPFPAYVSGHATFGGALFQTLRRYFGNDAIPFTFVSDELDGQTQDNAGNVRPLRPRSFLSLSQAEEENGQSRIYLGIHWSFDKTQGIRMGNQVADWTFDHVLAPRI